MRVFSKAQIVAHFNPELAVSQLEEGFIAYSEGKVQVPPVQGFAFKGANGDCCVKSAYIEGSPTFTVKLSTGFYDNPSKGLPSNDGLMLVLSAHTGQPLALLQDQGWLTAMRTALAGRIAARLLAPSQVKAIGILGTGMQAQMQLEQLRAVTDCRQVIVWGRHERGLAAYTAFARELGFAVHSTQDAAEVAGAANLIVCTTPSPGAVAQRLGPAGYAYHRRRCRCTRQAGTGPGTGGKGGPHHRRRHRPVQPVRRSGPCPRLWPHRR